MENIRTTATQVEKMRAEAKSQARATGAKLGACLEQVAKAHGYEHWKHVTTSLARHQPSLPVPAPTDTPDHSPPQAARDGLAEERHREVGKEMARELDDYFERLTRLQAAPFQVEPLRGKAFHRVTIEGVTFSAYADDEPYLACDDGDVALGVAQVERATSALLYGGPSGAGTRVPPPYPYNGPGLYVCKYDPTQPRISLRSLSRRGVVTLAQQFGLLVFEAGFASYDSLLAVNVHMPAFAFFRSPAATALQQWCRSHPKQSAAFDSKTDYLLYWNDYIGKEWPKLDDPR